MITCRTKGLNMTDIKYDDASHSYTIDGNKMKSVTEIATEILELDFSFCTYGSAERGTLIHTELANYFDPSVNFTAKNFVTDEAPALAKFLKPEPDMRTEMIVYNKELGYAGTIDLLREHDTVVTDIVDWKSGKVNKKYCTIQLSLYKLALESMGYDCSNTRLRVISPKGITIIEAKSWDEIQDMRKTVLAPDDEEIIDAEERLKELEVYVNEYNELKEKMKSYFVDVFKLTGSTKYSGAEYTISYVEPSTRTSLDSAKLRDEMPEVYEKYVRTTQVAGTVKFTKRTNED